ncbi:MAG: anaerobic ribonucleoside-triphosphate reductase [bacterium]
MIKAKNMNNSFTLIHKRDGRIIEFDRKKITNAIFAAAKSVGGENIQKSEELTDMVIQYLYSKYNDYIPNVEEIQDAIEKVLIETGHAKTAKSFILYRNNRNNLRNTKDNTKKKSLEKTDITDFSLFVRKNEGIAEWNRNRIIDVLIKEANIPSELATQISLEVEKQIIKSNIKVITSSLIRELVDVKLIEYGLEEARKKHTRLGVPLYDVEQIIFDANKENANIPHNPEAINMTLAEAINKQYALIKVFSQDVADAHIKGDIHIHDLGFISRPYCSGQSLEFIKKFGLTMPNSLSITKPAKHPETLLAHMVKFSAALQGHFAGAIGWDAVNIFFAPFLVGLSDRDLKQLAQMLIFEYSQQSVARGGQAIFSDINLYWEIPKHFENTLAIGPGGEYTGKCYKDYANESRKFLWALFDVYKEGDASGRPFFFPKPLVHITEKFFKTPGHQDFLLHISEVASEKGNTYFVFDRGETMKVSECCRLSFKLEQSDIEDAKTPWNMRFCALQNVTLNLPRVAYIANHDEQKLFQKLDEYLELSVKAHIQKKRFIEKLLLLEDKGPLALLAAKHEGKRYIRMEKASFLIGILGLNEMVEYHLGKELHASKEMLKFGIKIIAYINLALKKLSEKYKMKFVLEQTPAESTAYRLAKLDLEYFTEQSKPIIKGDMKTENIYYTNSTYLNISHPISPIERIQTEGIFHPLIEAGALSHIWIADSRPDAGSIADFVTKTFKNTQNAQIAFSPEFTSCNSCFKLMRGLKEVCEYCNSDKVDGITRITGYFSKISGWNKGKKGELNDRYRTNLS